MESCSRCLSPNRIGRFRKRGAILAQTPLPPPDRSIRGQALRAPAPASRPACRLAFAGSQLRCSKAPLTPQGERESVAGRKGNRKSRCALLNRVTPASSFLGACHLCTQWLRHFFCRFLPTFRSSNRCELCCRRVQFHRRHPDAIFQRNAKQSLRARLARGRSLRCHTPTLALASKRLSYSRRRHPRTRARDRFDYCRHRQIAGKTWPL